MQKFKILILVDHSKHNSSNSIYRLVREMLQHASCESIDIGSRGSEENQAFFENCKINKIWAINASSTFAYDSDGSAFKSDILREVDLQSYDVIFMRLPRPIEDSFLRDLSSITKNQIIFNNPIGMIHTSNKQYLLNYPELCPRVEFCYSILQILQFASIQETVLKPLREYGGKGLIRIKGDTLEVDGTLHNTRRYLNDNQDYIKREGYLAMAFLKNVSQGDKRIIVINGKVIGASLRIPAKNKWLCNVAQGGNAEHSDVTKEEIRIVETLNTDLRRRGIIIYGVDTLVDDDGKRVLSEVNTLSIGGFIDIGEPDNHIAVNNSIQEIFNYIIEEHGKRNTADHKVQS